MAETQKPIETVDIGEYKYGFHDDVKPVFKSRKGLDTEVINEMCDVKGEPDWMRQYRLKAYEIFKQKPDLKWGGDLSDLDYDDIYYYVKASDRVERSWDDVPDDIKKTFDRLGIPEAERKFLAGVGAQYDSEVVYHNIEEELEKIGVIFVDTDTAIREYPGSGQRIFRHSDSVRGQQTCRTQLSGLVGRLFHLCPARRKSRLPAASVFPHQQRKYGTV